MLKLSKLSIGTVQFGLNYGISNSQGKTNLAETVRIVKEAASNDIHVYDTAPAYGESEFVLGKVLSSKDLIITKTEFISEFDRPGSDVISLVERKFHQSLKDLNRPSVYGLVVHNVSDLKGPYGEQLYAWLNKQKDLNLCSKIGVSIYSSEDIDFILNKYDIDMVQLPFNIIDQNLLKDKSLERLKNCNIEIHARSVFLQGLLLLSINDLPKYFSPYKTHLTKFHQAAKKLNLSRLELCLNFVLNTKEIDFLTLGVNDVQQLSQIIKAVKHSFDISTDFSYLSSEQIKLTNPGLWEI